MVQNGHSESLIDHGQYFVQKFTMIKNVDAVNYSRKNTKMSLQIVIFVSSVSSNFPSAVITLKIRTAFVKSLAPDDSSSK